MSTKILLFKKEISSALQVVSSHFRHPKMSVAESRLAAMPYARDSPQTRLVPQIRGFRGNFVIFSLRSAIGHRVVSGIRHVFYVFFIKKSYNTVLFNCKWP